MTQKSFTVVARNGKIKKQGLFTGRGHRKFEKTGMQIYDAGEAAEIKAKYKRDVTVTEDPRHEWHLKNDRQTDGENLDIHHYTFGANQRYAQAWEAYEKRRNVKTAAQKRGGKNDIRRTA